MTVHVGDCREVLPTLAADSFDSCVTDPPYGLSFMGKEWDHGAPGEIFWREVLRVLKPGAHLLAFGGTRTYHRLTCAIEDAGFEVRDCIMWVYASGFPKSLDVSKAIDREAGAERERIAGPRSGGMAALNKGNATHGYRDAAYYDGGNMLLSSEPATDAARQWSGWGTALKPAWEPIIVARKPLSGTVAANVQRYGTGAINVDGCRVEAENGRPLVVSARRDGNGVYRDGLQGSRAVAGGTDAGRWPANLIHDGSEEVVAGFPRTAPSPSKPVKQGGGQGYKPGADYGAAREGYGVGYGDTGSAARFFYTAKASREDREEGCDALPMKSAGEATGGRQEGSAGLDNPRAGASRGTGARNHHPTVKPTDLMRYLCRLVTPPGGHVLDPFCGSGSTLKAARLEGFRATGIELSDEYAEIARARSTAGTMGLAL